MTLGIGVAAHSYFNGCVYFNERNLNDYLDRIKNNTLPIYLGHRLTLDQKMRRAIVLGLKRGYVNKCSFENLFGKSINQFFPDEIGRLCKRKMIVDNSASIRVKFEGMLFINKVCESFFTKEDRTILDKAGSSGAYGSYLPYNKSTIEEGTEFNACSTC